MTNLLFYKSRAMLDQNLQDFSGLEKFAHFFKIYNFDVSIIDRSHTIKLPIKTKSLFPIPKFRIFTKTYEEICNDRAKELLQKAENMKVKLYVFYSGGIDSTLILVSLLKNCTETQKQNIIVLMSEDSIAENPNFYKDYILGKLETESSINFPYLLGSNNLFVTGEHNDQLFGADVVGSLVDKFGSQIINETYDKKKLIEFFNSKENNNELNTFYVNLFEKLVLAAPVKITTYHEFLWWINFSLKWQSVYMRVLAFTNKKQLPSVTPDYLNNNYCTFYGTEEFQLWSMNNLDKKIKDTWKTYKWICKDIIYAFNKDNDYRENKVKVGSLFKLMQGNESSFYITEEFKFVNSLNIVDLFEADNDFK